uniref:THAP domain-containing protein 1 n=1 Tax=Xiphophorus couchianus TaxID=32473 RepID=A0A3B5L3Y6_9TELE
MPYHCVAYGCGKTVEDGVTLFRFPKDPDEFRKWEKQVQRTRVKWVATSFSHLCSEHFGKEYFEDKMPSGTLKLRPGAAPTVFWNFIGKTNTKGRTIVELVRKVNVTQNIVYNKLKSAAPPPLCSFRLANSN